MKQKVFIFMGVILSAILAVQLSSCNNKEQEEVCVDYSESANILQKFASIHNSGLDYIKLHAEKKSEKYTKCSLDSVFKEYVISQYGRNNADEILQQVDVVKEFVLNGAIPTLTPTRSNENCCLTVQTNHLAKAALDECMGEISCHLKNVNENEIFDNKPLLEELHAVINKTYTAYATQSISDTDAESLSTTLGVLSGSIEYWTNSNNVDSWSRIYLENEEKLKSESASNSDKGTSKEEEKKKLSKSEWLQTIAAADAIGAMAGGAAAVICSAAAALYFDVE